MCVSSVPYNAGLHGGKFCACCILTHSPSQSSLQCSTVVFHRLRFLTCADSDKTCLQSHTQVTAASQLVTSTQTSKHQSRTAAAVITLTRSLRSLPLLKKCTRNWAENKVNNKAHAVLCSLHVQWAEQRVIVWICDRCSNQLLCSSWNQCSPGPIITAYPVNQHMSARHLLRRHYVIYQAAILARRVADVANCRHSNLQNVELSLLSRWRPLKCTNELSRKAVMTSKFYVIIF